VRSCRCVIVRIRRFAAMPKFNVILGKSKGATRFTPPTRGRKGRRLMYSEKHEKHDPALPHSGPSNFNWPVAGDAGGGDASFTAALAQELACLTVAAARTRDLAPRAATAEALAACSEVPLGGHLAGMPAKGKLRFVGARTGFLSHGLYAPLLERAARAKGQAVVAVSQRGLYDDGLQTLGAVAAELGPRFEEHFKRAKGAVKMSSYESLTGKAAFNNNNRGALYGGHRHRLNASTVEALDSVFR